MSKKRRIESESEEDSEEDYYLSYPELEKSSSKIKKLFKTTCTQIKSEEPSLTDILEGPCLQADRLELFQLFDVYRNMIEENSLEKIEVRKQLITKYRESLQKYKQHKKFSEQEHATFQTEIEDFDEDEELKYEILKLETSKTNRCIIYNRYKQMLSMSSSDDEYTKLRNWLKCAVSIPHDRIQKFSYNSSELSLLLQRVSKKLDEEMYGMRGVKEQILIYLNSRILNPHMKRCSLGLIGPAGCGKTWVVTLLAQILNIPIEQISLGGIRSPDYLKGHQYTYIGAECGNIVKCMSRMGVKNGILFFDEYDKISDNNEVCSALLHITDPVQNNKFQDNFLSDITIDLSYLWFFYSMNNKPRDDALSDRIFYIDFFGYSQSDKFEIVKHYLLKRALKNIGWKSGDIIFEDNMIKELVETFSPFSDKGVRALEHVIGMMMNKLNFLYNQSECLKEFEMSFDLGMKIKFPFRVTKGMMTKLRN